MRSIRRIPLLVATTLLLVIIPRAASASVATSCSFDSGTATVTATIGSGASVTVERSGDAISFDGSPCGAADVFNTDTINITAPDFATTEELTISLAGGDFAPGKTAEGDGSDEIEMGVSMNDEPITIEGGPGDDVIELLPYGADLLSSGGDVEREVEFFPDTHGTLNLLGGAGADHLDILALSGTVLGGPGHDELSAGISQPSKYDGGTGLDTMTYFGSSIFVHATGAGSATVDRTGGTDTLVALETIEGTDADDIFIASDAGSHYVGNGGGDNLIGGAGPDRLIGGPGNDGFGPLGGDDVVRGGSGIDGLGLPESPAGVSVDFDDGTVEGEGNDTFGSVELILGSTHADVFAGDPRVARIRRVDGGGGRDLLDLRTAIRRQLVFTSPTDAIAVPSWVRFVAEDIRHVIGSPLRDRIVVGKVNGKELRGHFFGVGGNDRLVGGSHQDVLDGGARNDTLNGGDGRDTCTGGPGSDSISNCEA